ncbi:hypothetical protein GCM10010191_09210 [Actinomadura vinacea]|uniref:Uncharacterized protein n=1 Tax=Actinomadura vinacea TaxID=115336 RepID=A0ABP5VI11_9ACTN
MAEGPTGGFGDLPGGIVNPWDRQVSHGDLSFTDKKLYKLSFDARATRNVTIAATVNTFTDGQYIPRWERPITLTTGMRHFELPVAVYGTGTRTFSFNVGTYDVSYTLHLDNVSLTPVPES